MVGSNPPSRTILSSWCESTNPPGEGEITGPTSERRMVKGKKNKGGNGKEGGQRMVRVEGPGGFKLQFPWPHLPSWLGAASRLAANAAVYPRVDLDMPMIMNNVAIVAGATATVVAVDVATLVAGWTSRFANTFREYCVVGLRLEHNLTVSTNASGVVLAFVDETLATVPNAGSLYTPHMEVPIVQAPDGSKLQLLEYVPSGSYTDLQWTPTTVPVTRQWVKYYASTSTGTGATTTGTIIVRGTLAVSFRGYANF